MASIAWLVYSSLKKGQKHAGETNYPVSKDVLTSTLFQRCFAKIPFLKGCVVPFVNLPFSRVKAWISFFPFSRVTYPISSRLPPRYLVFPGRLLLPASSCHRQFLQSLPTRSAVFKGTLQNVHTVIEQGFAALFDTQ